jgi:hypothetical protein
MNLKDKKVCVYDGGGLFVSLALRLAELKQFAEVAYFREWQDGFCDGRELVVGSGLEKYGVKRLKYFWKDPETGRSPIDDYDLFVFPDCWQPDTQEYLRSLNKRVWGAGWKTNLELARWKTKELMDEIGLPKNEAAQIHGLENLRVYLQQNENVFVKISGFRGIGETFESETYEQSKGQIDEYGSKYGRMMDLVDFVVEKKIPDAKEIGYDGYCIDGEFPDNAFVGLEVKDKAYFGKLVDYDELPDEVKDANTKLSYHMDGYRQFWSTEIRNGVVIDITARHASPAGETYIHAYANLPEILYSGAEGKLVHGETTAKFAAQIIFCSEWAEEHCLELFFPEEVRPYFKIYHHCIIDGVDCCMPQLAKMKQVGSIIGLGNTPDEACNAAKERAKQVKGYDLEAETDALDKAVKEMEDFDK